jgi:hypothetical protein
VLPSNSRTAFLLGIAVGAFVVPVVVRSVRKATTGPRA